MNVSMKALLGVSRAPFLLLSVLLVASASAASAWDAQVQGTGEGFSWLHTLLALVGLAAMHIAVNAFNEASDMANGIDLATVRTPFSGGSGTLPAGLLSVTGARIVAAVGLGIGLAIGGYFLVVIGWALLPILALGVLAVVAYSPWMLRIGLGEVFAGLGLGALPVLGTALVQDGIIGPAAIAVSVPAFFMTFNLLLLNEFPDEQADRAGGRRHLVILLGRRRAAQLYAGACLATALAILVAVIPPVAALPTTALVAWVALGAAAPAIIWALRRAEQAVPIPALAGNVMWNLGTHLVLAAVLSFVAIRC